MSNFNAKYWAKRAPDWASCIAVDADCYVFAYQLIPNKDEVEWFGSGRMKYLGKVDYIENWKESLTMIQTTSSNESVKIDAAPDLLEALKYVANRIEASDEWWMDCPNRGGFDLEMINAAIAKAEGTTP